MKCSIALAASFVIAASLFSSIARAAEIVVSIDGADSSPVECYWEPYPNGNGGQWIIGKDGRDGFEWGTEEGSVKIEARLDPDPEIFFSVTAVDFGAPSNFSYSFVMPLNPLVSNPSIVFDSLSGSVTNGAAAGGVTVTALAPPPGIPVDGDGIDELQVYTLSDDNQATWQNVGLDAGPGVFIPLGSFGAGLYPASNQGPIATIPGGPWTDMRADINFGLSGGGDTLTLNGVKVLVPEPTTVVFALVFAALAGFARRRNPG